MAGLLVGTGVGIMVGTTVGMAPTTAGVITRIGDFGDGDIGDGLFWDGPTRVGLTTNMEGTHI